MKKTWKWEWPWHDTYVHFSYFPLTVTWLWALISPEGFGHWIGKIVMAVKVVI